MTPRDIACQELVELVTEYLEGALPPDEVAAVDRHLTDCDSCLRYLRQMRATGRALSLLPTEQVTETLSEEAVDTLLAAFRRRPGAGGDHRGAAGHRFDDRQAESLVDPGIEESGGSRVQTRQAGLIDVPQE